MPKQQQEQSQGARKERTPAQMAAAAKLVEMNKQRRAERAALGGQASSPKEGAARTHRKGGSAGTATRETEERGQTAAAQMRAAPLGIPEGSFDAGWVQECILLGEKYGSVGNLYTLATTSWGQNNVALANQYTLAANRMLIEANNLQTNFRSSNQTTKRH